LTFRQLPQQVAIVASATCRSRALQSTWRRCCAQLLAWAGR